MIEIRDDKDVYDKILEEVKLEKLLLNNPLLKKNRFIYEYEKEDDEGWRFISSNCGKWNPQPIYNLVHDAVIPNKFKSYIFMNIFIYFLIRSLNSNELITDKIKSVLNEKKLIIRLFNRHIEDNIKHFQVDDKNFIFFPALKWFYSEKTKHLYSKELLKKMKDYEEELKGIKWNDCTIEYDNSKLWRLRK